MENKKRRTLIIINTQFPYGKSEDFLSNELEYANGFDEIVCFPILAYGLKTKYPITFFNSLHSYKSKAKFRKLLFFTLKNPMFYKELFILISTKRLTFRNLKQLFIFLFIAGNAIADLSRIMKDSYSDSSIVLYSYWMHIGAFTAISLEKKFKKEIHIEKQITRCHRFDLYEYADAGKYLPMRQYIHSNMNEIHAISEDAVLYLENQYKLSPDKLKLSRLGSLDRGINIFSKGTTLKLVSCSWMRPVKRVSAIVSAVAALSVKADWVHFGDGEEFELIKDLVNKLGNPLVNVKLMGAYSNEKVLQEYAEKKYDVFINVSENEGVPVSIMEAMSFGKIIVATNVGGTAEIVENGVNGFLLDKDFTNAQLTSTLTKIALLDPEEFDYMCRQSRRIWEERCNAATNYEEFYQQLEANVTL
jgi:colanic acid/amylovoran biosynthesis glycosyltransferase